ncbi:PRD domain-containing protein [Enterococcus dongliensis]|uniref:PRD domain-containing protein n=1 Tax=Enterococcus dongliensis TaxID=2559925 RepID=A0AAP5ND63_9ENTE|nr:PRD domain-containing protein [Enterococcus dongliensis]MDT2597924.1 PRD domain-containing protein [Enterococcus dongliensis]MDT2604890.1 PRD domain-containing protein [Enterococcus dongliensis]MDT2612658.1 PRD domain-containing protein [Enterococcus dongliensis]MDT2635838.1 PRD domain-containing protein [Enterococcus dongliensis]MDT2638381.1 PRD domain-containing protein [Enterococcus dongliensis]
MIVTEEALQIISTSKYQKELEELITWLRSELAEKEIEPTELQWTILINHLNEMLNRSNGQESIPAVDPELFSEVSQDALTLADGVVKKIGNLPQDEMYVLSIHFETAKQN